MADLANLTADDFEPLLNDRFILDDFEVELSEVNRGGQAGGSREQFSLIFNGGPSPPLPQGIRALEHPGVGRLELFLVPIAEGRYEAVFA
jgi:hypothetical protein